MPTDAKGPCFLHGGAGITELPQGLPVFEDRQCGNGVPTLLSTTAIANAVSGAVALPAGLLPPGLLPSQLGEVFPPQLRALVEQFIFKLGEVLGVDRVGRAQVVQAGRGAAGRGVGRLRRGDRVEKNALAA